MKNLIEERLSSQHAYAGRFIDVWRDTVKLPDNRETTREVVKHPGAIVAIPILPDGKIMLIRQFRYAMGEVEIELPAGKLDPGETPLDTLHRELAEEIGYRSNKVTPIVEIRPCIGFSNERMWLFIAEELVPENSEKDHDEFLELLPTPFPECLQLVKEGTIKDVKTIIGLFWAEKLFAKQWLPPSFP